MNIILLGSPGIGKGTIAKLLQSQHNFLQISTGDLVRQEIKSGSELGKQMDALINKGFLVPDNIITAVLKKAIPANQKNIVFDGYPRTIPQAESLQKIAKIDFVISLVADDEIIIDRLSGRRICTKCGTIYHIKYILPKKEGICDKDNTKLIQREDDKEKVVKQRLEVYRKQTKPLEDFYKKKNLLKNVNAEDNPKNILKIIEKILKLD